MKPLTLGTVGVLCVPPLLWAGNVVIGRLAVVVVPPLTLNFLRWGVALLLLLPFASWVLRRDSALWSHWRRYALLGLLGCSAFNSLQYMALETSTALNATLVSGSGPFFMLMMGALFFGQRIAAQQLAGATLSLAGVVVVLTHGDLGSLANVRFVRGDLLLIMASLIWSWYSWLLSQGGDPPDIRNDWSAHIMAQLIFGFGWSGLFAATEWTVVEPHIDWSWPIAAALLYVAVGPAILAFRCWTAGVQRAGPSTASFFSNLTAVFAAGLSAVFLGEMPRTYHAIAFLLIVCGIVVSSRK